jgi:hypothetical protein
MELIFMFIVIGFVVVLLGAIGIGLFYLGIIGAIVYFIFMIGAASNDNNTQPPAKHPSQITYNVEEWR